MLLTVSTLCKATELFGHSRLITVSQEPLQALLGCVLYRHITAAGSSAISSYISGFFSFCSRLGSTRKKKLHKPRHHFFKSQMSILLIPRVCLCVENLLSRYSCKFGPKCHADRNLGIYLREGKGSFEQCKNIKKSDEKCIF